MLIGLLMIIEIIKLEEHPDNSTYNALLQEAFVKMLEDRGVNIPVKHLNNSAGIMNFDEYFDMCDNNNRQFYIKSSYESEAEFIQTELVDMGMLDDCTSFDDIQDLVKRYGELWKAIESLKDDEVVALDEESWHFEKVKRYVTSYHEDRYTYAIALSIV